MSKAAALADHKAKPATERKSSIGKLRGIPLDLATAVANLNVKGEVIIRVEDVPAGVRLSAGDAASGLVTGEEGQDKTSVWSLRVADLEDLHLLTSASEPANYPLTIRILLPDPDGYDYATTAGVLITNKRISTDQPTIMDIAPTVLTFFGLPVPGYIDGKSLW